MKRPRAIEVLDADEVGLLASPYLAAVTIFLCATSITRSPRLQFPGLSLRERSHDGVDVMIPFFPAVVLAIDMETQGFATWIAVLAKTTNYLRVDLIWSSGIAGRKLADIVEVMNSVSRIDSAVANTVVAEGDVRMYLNCRGLGHP